MEELSAAEEVGRLVRGRGDRLESSGQAEVKMVPFASARLTVEEDPEQGFLVFGVILNAPDIWEVCDRVNLQIDLGSMVVEPFPDLSDGVRDPTGGEYGDAGVADFTIAHEESLRDNAERRPESGEEVHGCQPIKSGREFSMSRANSCLPGCSLIFRRAAMRLLELSSGPLGHQRAAMRYPSSK